MSKEDAAKIGVHDNDWIEAVNRNGVVVARAVVSHRMPQGTVYMHHAQGCLIDVPLTETNGQRGGIHNSLTWLMVKPSHLIGGYAQLTYAFNYLGPTGKRSRRAFREPDPAACSNVLGGPSCSPPSQLSQYAAPPAVGGALDEITTRFYGTMFADRPELLDGVLVIRC